MIRRFAEDNARAHEYQYDQTFCKILQKLFIGSRALRINTRDVALQKCGIDAWIVYPDRLVSIDFKFRKDTWPDFALEFWHTYGASGWIEKDDLVNDYIAYIHVQCWQIWLIPREAAQRAWVNNARRWIGEYHVICSKNAGYDTHSCPVPKHVLINAVSGMAWADSSGVYECKT
jgi:hypothetical protein